MFEAVALSLGLAIVLSYLVLEFPRVSISDGGHLACGDLVR